MKVPPSRPRDKRNSKHKPKRFDKSIISNLPWEIKEIFTMTMKEAAFFQCAFMILNDQCPPERKHYLCMTEEDDSVQDCTQCWSSYLWNLTMGYIEIPSQNDILPALKYGIFPRRLYKTDGERC